MNDEALGAGERCVDDGVVRTGVQESACLALDVLAPGTRACESHLCARGGRALGRIGEGGGEDAVLYHGYHALVSGGFLAEVSRVAHGAALLALVRNVFASFVVVLTTTSVAFPLGVGRLACRLRRAGSCRAWRCLITTGQR